MRAAFGAELWDRPGQARRRAEAALPLFKAGCNTRGELYWGRTGFCE